MRQQRPGVYDGKPVGTQGGLVPLTETARRPDGKKGFRILRHLFREGDRSSTDRLRAHVTKWSDRGARVTTIASKLGLTVAEVYRLRAGDSGTIKTPRLVTVKHMTSSHIAKG